MIVKLQYNGEGVNLENKYVEKKKKKTKIILRLIIFIFIINGGGVAKSQSRYTTPLLPAVRIAYSAISVYTVYISFPFK
jgi:hypothetical protein